MNAQARGRFRTLAVAGLSALGVATMFSTLSTAHADTPLADVTGFRTQNLSVASTGCQDIPVTMSVTVDPSVWYVDIKTDIYRGTTRVGYTWFEPNVASTWQWCPAVDGLGTFRLGPSSVQAYTDQETVEATDTTAANVTIKARTTAAVVSTARSGSYVTVQGRARYFSTTSGTYVNWPNASLTVQYRLPGTTTWKSAGTVATNSYGLAGKKVYAPKARYWRVTVNQTATKWPATSGQVSR
jgi:hypothetical protein